MGGVIKFNIKKILCALFLLLCIGILFSQETAVQESSFNEEDFLFEDETGDGVDESSNTVSETSDFSGTSTLWLFVRMIFALILVVAVIYVIVFFLKKVTNPKPAEQPFLKRAATLSLGPGKSVQVITMPDKAWLIGVSDAGIQTIGEINDTELVTQLILEAEKQPSDKVKDFASIFNAFMPGAKATEKTLKKQRERLKNGGFNE